MVLKKHFNPTGERGHKVMDLGYSFFVIAQRQYWQKLVISRFVYDGFNFK